ncbi:uncharacterized protein QC763_0043580 [Podospora pseudopauciseta]|uniref:Uncharacterized protein n=1 Tax=Podospora pseudopauciseta TaxID=2093780 RepID=A0ABR0HQZ5_9PEZI|nr:hypothetical protein QC763_0043580 [Podospora pseudopauciseta]
MHLLKLPKNVRGGCQSSSYGLHVEPMDLGSGNWSRGAEPSVTGNKQARSKAGGSIGTRSVAKMQQALRALFPERLHMCGRQETASLG